MKLIFQTVCRVFTALSLVSLLSVHSANAQLAAHRAVYDISLKKAEDRSGITGVRGRMVIELTGNSCEGWNVTFRMINQYLLQRGLARLADNRSNSWEAADGSQLRYTQRQFIDNRLENEILLKADRSADGSKLTGQMTKPTEQEFQLPADGIFPAQHQIRLLAAATSGRPHDRSIVFDGSEGAKAYLAVSFIGNPLTNQHQNGEGGKELETHASWPVSVSYYTIDEAATEGVPVYQVRFRMFDNGVAGDLILDYGDFVLDGKLSLYEALKPAACE